MIVSRASVAARSFSTSLVRRSDHHGRPAPGSNLPFDISNRYKLTAYFIAYLGSAFSLPFYVWHKKSMP